MGIIEIRTSEEFRNLVKTKKPLVIKFGAGWCSDCKELQPHFESKVRQLENEGITVARFYLSHFKKLAKSGKMRAVYPGLDFLAIKNRYSPHGFPTIAFFKEGNVVATSVEDNKETYRNFVTHIMGLMKK